MSALADILSDLGVEVRRQTGDEINGRCPVHEFYKGRSSSGYHWYINEKTGLWQCFTCGARGSLPMLVADLTNDPRAINGVNLHIARMNLDRLGNADEEQPEDVRADLSVFSQFEHVPSFWLERKGLDADVARRYLLRFNRSMDKAADGRPRPDHRCLIMPVLDRSGNIKGWQAKQQGGYFANVPTGMDKSSHLFGMFQARHDVVVLVESPLDVVRFHSVIDTDMSCVSCYGADVSKKQIAMLRDKFKKIVIAMDNDKRGHAASKGLSGSFRNIRWLPYNHTNAKDIGDMTEDELKYAVDNVSSVPQW